MSGDDVATGSDQSSSPPSAPAGVADTASERITRPTQRTPTPRSKTRRASRSLSKKATISASANGSSYVVTTQRPGYLTVLDATPDGKLTQVYPTAMSLRSAGSPTLASTLIHPGKPVVIPDYRNLYRGFDVQITEPRGKGVMVAVLSDKPLTSFDTPQAPKTFASPKEGVKVIHRLRDELARSLSVQPKSSTAAPPWSVAYRGVHHSIRLERQPQMVLDKPAIYGLHEGDSGVSLVATCVGRRSQASQLSGSR